MVYSLGSDKCGSSEGEHFVHAKMLLSSQARRNMLREDDAAKEVLSLPVSGSSP